MLLLQLEVLVSCATEEELWSLDTRVDNYCASYFLPRNHVDFMLWPMNLICSWGKGKGKGKRLTKDGHEADSEGDGKNFWYTLFGFTNVLFWNLFIYAIQKLLISAWILDVMVCNYWFTSHKLALLVSQFMTCSNGLKYITFDFTIKSKTFKIIV